MERNDWLDQMPKSLQWAEIGVFKGEFTREILTRTSPVCLHAVDKFPAWTQSGDSYTRNMTWADLRGVPAELKAVSDVIQPHVMPSSEFFAEMIAARRTLDVIYVDADHEYAGVRADLAGAEQLLGSGGILAAHDYNRQIFPGVYRAINELVQTRRWRIHYITDEPCATVELRRS